VFEQFGKRNLDYNLVVLHCRASTSINTFISNDMYKYRFILIYQD